MNYSLGEKVIEQDGFLWFDGHHEPSGSKIYLKTFTSYYPSRESVLRLKREYQLLRKLSHPGIIKVTDLVEEGNRFYMISEPVNGVLLSEFIQEGPVQASQFFKIAIQITKIVEYFHGKNFFHKDLHPSNILINPDSLDIKIINFHLFSDNRTEHFNPSHAFRSTFKLGYCSPELTGRMNKKIDFRTDLYTLGVLFFKMLTGQLPFPSEDPLEVIHGHLAKSPPRISSLRKEYLPPGIDLVVYKLLAKDHEDRYQSAKGLRADLMACTREKDSGNSFVPGLQDKRVIFEIPQKLYGREQEINQLNQSFEKINTQSLQMLLVHGYSGIGKSSLINELYKPLTAQRGYFITGKFDQYKRNTPYSALIQAFENLINLFLQESESKIQYWKNKLAIALGENAGVITDVIPHLELIIGKPPAAKELPPKQAENRFENLFLRFIDAISSDNFPILLFLDDLQWADTSSLNLLEVILKKGKQNKILILGAFRDNEVQAGHPLDITLTQLNKANVEVERIKLKPLPFHCICQLIADTLNMEMSEIEPLARLAQKKTNGNPFFLIQFLKTLRDENLIHYNQNSQVWNWNLTNIDQALHFDNVVDLLTQNICKLPKESIDLLSTSAAIGNEFDLDLLSTVYQQPDKKLLVHHLHPAVREELVLPSEQGYQAIAHYQVAEELDFLPKENSPKKVSFKFYHDRVQQAAYSMIPQKDRPALHINIGRLLLGNLQQLNVEEKTFEILDHFLKGKTLLTELKEKRKVAELCLIAGKKAKKASSYQTALQFLQFGMELLGDDYWGQRSIYQLSIDLTTERAECEYLNLNYKEAEKYFDDGLKHADSKLEKLRILHIRNLLYTKINKTREALEVGRQAVKLYGIKFPRNPLILKIGALVNVISFKATMAFRGLDVEKLYHWKETEDSEEVALNALMLDMATSAYQSQMDLMPMIALRILRRSLKHGYTPPTAYAYGAYAVVIASGLGQFRQGFEFGQMAVRLSERLYSPIVRWKLPFVFATFIAHWRDPIRKHLHIFPSVIKGCLANGDHVFAGFGMAYYFHNLMASGDNLSDTYQTGKNLMKALRNAKDYTGYYMTLSNFQLLKLLIGKTQFADSLEDKDFVEENILKELKMGGNKNALALHQTYKLHYLFLFDKMDEVLALSDEMEPLEENLLGLIAVAEYNYYLSLAILRKWRTLSRSDKRKYRRRLALKQFWMKKWAKNAPANFGHKQQLIKAEKAKNKGRFKKAIDLYDLAIAGAIQQEFHQDAALTNELAAKFLLEQGKNRLAEMYLQEAYYYLLKWGASTKAEYFKKQYAHVVEVFKADEGKEARRDAFKKEQLHSSSVDVFSIIKASTAISREIDLGNLLETMIRIIIENTGAQRGLLILKEKSELLVEAESILDPPLTEVLQSKSVKNNPDLPESLILFVTRTKESVVLNDALQDKQFGQDPYILSKQSKSILCVPILKQSRIVGLIYLENNLTYKAFRPKQTQIVDILAGVASNSIENAKLYKNLNNLNVNLKSEVEQRKAAQEAVIVSEQRLQQYLDGVPVGIAVITADGTPFYINETGKELLGKGVNQSVDEQNISEYYGMYEAGSEEYYPAQRLPIVQALLGKSKTVKDIEIRKGDKRIAIEGSATPIYQDGEIVFAISVFKDITKELESEREIQESLEYQTKLVKSYSRFVPREFLNYLKKQSVLNVKLADYVINNMSILFVDIRSYTTLAEKMSLNENFQFINKYLGIISPIIEEHSGLINQYYGDGVMSLFNKSAEDALKASIALFKALKEYNKERIKKGRVPVKVGAGLHTGPLVLGVIGSQNRMDATVVSDAVNTAARMEGLTKIFGAPIIISDTSYKQIKDPSMYKLRFLGKVKVKGKANFYKIYENYDTESNEIIYIKDQTLIQFNQGLNAYYQREFKQAAKFFYQVLAMNPADAATKFYLGKIDAIDPANLPDNWEGVVTMMSK